MGVPDGETDDRINPYNRLPPSWPRFRGGFSENRRKVGVHDRRLPPPHRPADFSVDGFLFEGFALVVRFAATAKPQQQLSFTAVEIDLERDEGQAFFISPAGKPLDFTPMQEQLAPTTRRMVEMGRLLVFGNVTAHKINLAVLETAVGFLKRYFASPQAFDLAPLQGEAAFQRLEDFILMARTAILRNQPLVIVLAIDRFLFGWLRCDGGAFPGIVDRNGRPDAPESTADRVRSTRRGYTQRNPIDRVHCRPT